MYFLYIFATLDFEILMPLPLVFEILMPPFFMPPPKDLKSLCHPLLCHPQKTLCHPVYATPRGGIKKRGVALKKNQWVGVGIDELGGICLKWVVRVCGAGS